MRSAVVICPCSNSAAGLTIDAVKRAIESPSKDVLAALQIDENTYQALMPSAIASITGTHRSLQQGPREEFVRLLPASSRRGAYLRPSLAWHWAGRLYANWPPLFSLQRLSLSVQTRSALCA